MKKHFLSLYLPLAWLLFSVTVTQSQEDILGQLSDIAIVEEKVMMPMRDGIRLATDIYRPKADGTYPIIFQEHPIILILGAMASSVLAMRVVL